MLIEILFGHLNACHTPKNLTYFHSRKALIRLYSL